LALGFSKQKLSVKNKNRKRKGAMIVLHKKKIKGNYKKRFYIKA